MNTLTTSLTSALTTGNEHAAPAAQPAPPSRRACSDPTGNDYAHTGATQPGVRGCAVCHNDGRYGRGDGVCGRCNRCHGCGSSNNGVGPLQAVWFAGRKAVRAVMGGDGGKGEGEEEVKGRK